MTNIRAQLSTLLAKKRSASEPSENVQKEAELALRKEQLCQITSVHNFFHPSNNANANASTSLDRLTQTSIANNKRLQQLEESSTAEKELLRESVLGFLSKLQQVEQSTKECEEIEAKLASLPKPTLPLPNVDVQERELKQLQEALRVQEEKAAMAKSKLAAEQDKLLECKKETGKLQVLVEEHAAAARQRRECEGARREQIEIMLGFAKLKTSVHEKLSGHRITSQPNPKRVELALNEDGAKIDLEFDSHFRLVHVRTNCILTGSRVEEELRSRALESNNAAAFVRKIKLLVHNSCALERELEELKEQGTIRNKFHLEYKPGTRIVTCLFREVLSVQLRVPFDYTISPVELVRFASTIIRKQDVQQDRLLEERVRAQLAHTGNLLVRDWVMAICKVVG